MQVRPSGPGPGMEHVEALVADVMRETGASAGLLYLLPPQERLLRLAVLSGVSLQIAAPWARAQVDASTPVTDAMRGRRLVFLDSREEVARRYPHLGLVLPYDFMLAAAPFIGGTHVWGGIVLLWTVGHPPLLGPHQREAITSCCRRAADLLEQAASQGRPLLPPEEPRCLPVPLDEADPARAMAALGFTERLPTGCCALDLEGRLTFINSAGADLVGADAASLSGRRPWEALPWLPAPVGEDSYRAAVVARRPTSFTAVRPPHTELLFQLYPDDSGISVHISPAARQTDTAQSPPSGERVGAMGLYHLTYLAAALAEAATVQEVTDVVADQIVPAFGPRGLVLMIADEGRLHIIGHRGYSAEFISRLDGTPLASDTPTTYALATGDPVFFATFADFQRRYPGAPRHDARSAWAFLPLTASGRRIGSVALSYDRARPFPPAERALLTSLAGLIGQALDRARLYDTKHSLAHALQTGLLPRSLPRVPGLEITARYRPAGHGMDIGGDFYDLIHAPTATTAAIGDVQGHNSDAAALMGQVRAAVHAHATAGTSPGELLARTNRLLTDLDAGRFTSCLIAQLDLARHRARLATAGHPPPLLRHPGGRTEVLPLPPGLLLGIDPDADYRTTELPLPPGAVLVLYTDGLVEVAGTDIDDTTDALAQHLAQTRIKDLGDLADDLIRHAERSAPRHDDIALLLIRPRPIGD
ncbi:SpoIIE family protein phosphatase [Streptomyces sp. WMMC940]|uniref:SpoIIE family protein phosphatase n=1 Tax=Streptomyces sp. WMMC940 TaxID=3015153 RepID=UPI0022B6C2E5|nr:SpoIIE family protein phosphatase [Streptomyces sp. WMMC940]MCZ7461985.1 SpoIIE family protein phosphatase [Streptomyces sp. WMMC940]